MHAKSTAAYKPTVKLTSHRGWYRVQSGTDPHTWYETSANSCTCPARKPCKHQKFVRSLNVAFFVRKEAEAPVVVPMTAGAPSGIVRPVQGNPTASVDAQIDAAESGLAQARRALHDTDSRDDSYAVLWRQVDGLEREVAALHFFAMRAA
ncbi:MAG: hypothetical protein M3Y74_06050 [Chloroflexota bacterium]|nr:hypothetical protein [Chloroflexota bacterium]